MTYYNKPNLRAHSFGVKYYLKEVTLYKKEPLEFLTMIKEMVSSRETWYPTHKSIIGGDDLLFFVCKTNDIDDCLLSRCLKDRSKAIMNE